MHRFGLSIALTGIVALLALPAVAADNGFYLGASVGQAGHTVDNFEQGDLEDFDFKADSNAYKIFLGYRFLNFFALEGSYIDFGTFNDSPSTGDELEVEANIKGYDLFGVGMLPLGIADIFAKVGVFNWDSDISGFVDDYADSGSDIAYGLGIQFRIKSFAIRAEAEYFDIQSSGSLYLVSVGGSYTF